MHFVNQVKDMSRQEGKEDDFPHFLPKFSNVNLFYINRTEGQPSVCL